MLSLKLPTLLVRESERERESYETHSSMCDVRAQDGKSEEK